MNQNTNLFLLPLMNVLNSPNTLTLRKNFMATRFHLSYRCKCEVDRSHCVSQNGISFKCKIKFIHAEKVDQPSETAENLSCTRKENLKKLRVITLKYVLRWNVQKIIIGLQPGKKMAIPLLIQLNKISMLLCLVLNKTRQLPNTLIHFISY